jgi:hypothetical protein
MISNKNDCTQDVIENMTVDKMTINKMTINKMTR